MIFNNILIKRALLNEKVTLFDPKEVVNLIEAKSEEEFEKWYNYYEKQDNIRKVKVDAIDILEEFFKQRYETGNIYEMFEENVQEQNMFKEKIYSSNLCTEILIPSYPLKLHNDKVVIDLDGNVYIEGTKENPGEIGLCNLSSINIAEFMEMSDKEKYKTCYTLLRSMDNLLDYAFYPVKEAEISNKLRRSVGIGVFNYAYYLAKNKALPESDEAKELTFRAFEDLAYFLHKASIELAKERGRAPWFHKTKYADGVLPQDLSKSPFKNKFEYKRNWDKIRKDYKSIGGRFSVLMAIAPTASSAIWSGATEGIEFPKDFIVQKTFNNIVEKQILPDLNKLGQYYKLAWDIDNKVIIELASIRQIFIDQSQSVSLYYTQEKGKYLSHKHLEDTIYAIKNGLKTLYYSYNKDEDQSKYKHCDSCQ